MRLILIVISTLLSIFELTMVSVFFPEYRANLVLVFWMVLVYLLSGYQKKEKEKFNFLPLLFISGLLFDFFSTDMFGIHALIFILCAAVLILVKKIPFQVFVFHFPLSLGTALFLYDSFFFAFYSLQGKTFSFDFLSFIFKSIILNIVLGFLFYPLLSFILKKLKMKGEIQLEVF